MSAINSLTLTMGSKSLDALWTRANVISDNIANADTPGYKEKGVTFESTLTEAMKNNTLTEDKLNNMQPEIVTIDSNADANGNSVDMESQMIDLTKNQLQYSYTRKAISDQLKMLRSAATEGKG
jgi:flagellar basal-body rod protein FlgB